MQTLPIVHKTHQMVRIEQSNNGKDIRLVLIDAYQRLGSQAAVAHEMGVSQQALAYWFEKLGIRIVSMAILEQPQTPPTDPTPAPVAA